MGGASNGNRGGKPTVLGSRFTAAEVAGFDSKRGTLTRSQALRLAVLEWQGVRDKSVIQ